MRVSVGISNIVTDLSYINYIESLVQQSTFEKEQIDFDFSMFNNIGVVGDSYANGFFNDANHPNFSWPAMINRKYGCNVENFSLGGLSTRTWLQNTSYGLTKLLNTDKQDLYLLVLERNDFNIEYRGETGYIGSIADITNHSLGNYPDTFYGNYATIIESILNYTENSKLIMITGDYKNTLGTQYNNAMVEIANHYNIPVMKQLDDSFFNSTLYRDNWPIGGHPGVIQYNGMLNAISRLFDKCVKENTEYFKITNVVEN